MPLRNLEFLNWRYGSDSPHANREIGIAPDQNGDLAGYVIFYLSGDDDKTGFILDLQTAPPHDTSIAAALMGYAINRLRSLGAWTVTYHHLSTLFNMPDEALRNFGFVARNSHQFMVKVNDEELADVAGYLSNWNFSYGDSEASHAIG